MVLDTNTSTYIGVIVWKLNEMKKVFLLILIINASLGVAFSQSTTSKNLLKFETSFKELGKVTKGIKVSDSFYFTNDSQEIVYIDLVSSCECTEVDWPTAAIKPGQKGKIDFVFDSSKKEDSETVSIDVFLRNVDKKTDEPIYIPLEYSYILVH